VRAALDEVREAFQNLYSEAEGIVQSSITAAKPRRAATPDPATPRPPASLRVRVARRVPVRYRRVLRRAVRSMRRPD
jgi:hypothetical protein